MTIDAVRYLNSKAVNGLNLYAYCFNRPIDLVDSSGNWPTFNDIKGWGEEVLGWFDENIVKPVANLVNEICNYDSSNEDEQKVLGANYISSYKETFILKIPGDNAFSFGILFIGNDYKDPNVVKHEYGHKLQLDQRGVLGYLTDIALPSVTAFWLSEFGKITYDYYGSPWESEADALGGVTRDYKNAPWPVGAPNTFWELIPLFFK